MKSKIFNIGLAVVLFIWLLTITVNALSFTAAIKASNTNVAESTEFTITVNVSNLDVGTNGINSLSGYLKYDTEVFETISESSIEGLNNWTAKFDESTGKIELTKTDFVKSAEEVFQVTFKTKSGVTGKSGTISYSNIVASNSESDISATDISTSITVGEGSSSQNTTNNTANNTTNNTTINILSPTNKVANNTVNKTANKTANNTANNAVNNATSNYTNTTAKENMPNTGADDTALALVFASIIVAIVFFVKIERINKEMK